MIYNIRNDNDNFVSIAGLFDTQDELQKQAESCVRYALKVKEIPYLNSNNLMML